ncbi:MAG: phosphatidylserine decarboxylase [Lachnospiraceae bacterium]|nr:phosphatidylserine decarboxylase [Lachnospiraceae bacterium]
MKYRDRLGNTIEGTTNQDKLLDKLYSNYVGRLGLKILSAPVVSNLGGAFLDTWMSTFLIGPFIKKNNIRMSDYEKRRYRSYNDFFTRKIKAGKRVIDKNPAHLIAPSDGKVTAYPITLDSKFKIKNSYYSVASMLRNKKLAKDFVGGYAVIIRLSVDNYHRYCYVDDAVKGRNYNIPGKLYTVNPVILDHVNIYKENSRSYCVLDTKNFGKVVQMEVGALMVGKITNYHHVAMVKRGEEKGKFEFGGSTVVLLLQRDQAVIAEDILRNTNEGYETLVKMGECIGEALY